MLPRARLPPLLARPTPKFATPAPCAMTLRPAPAPPPASWLMSVLDMLPTPVALPVAMEAWPLDLLEASQVLGTPALWLVIVSALAEPASAKARARPPPTVISVAWAARFAMGVGCFDIRVLLGWLLSL